MKKILSLILSAILLTTASAALAGGEPDALTAFTALTGTAIDPNAAVTSEQYLDKVMNDEYLTAPADITAAQEMAPELPGLSAVTTKDIAVYSVDKNLPAAQVRNKYFRSLANVLSAEIMVNPASEDSYKNIQTILSLFLGSDADNLTKSTREAVRTSITPAQASEIAKGYGVSKDFVEFVVMNDNWNDEDWTNDGSWKKEKTYTNWNTDDRYDSLEDYVDTDGIKDNSVDNTPDVNTPNTPDKNTPNTPDRYTPDTPQVKKSTATTTKRNSPNTPDRNTPNTPDRNTPNTPDRNTPNTPDRNTPNTPDRNTPNTPDRNSRD